MGCGASTPSAHQEVSGSGSSESAGRSPIARRFDVDIRWLRIRTSHKRSDSAVSDKQLLRDDYTDDGSSKGAAASPSVINKGDSSSDKASNVSVMESHDQVKDRGEEEEVEKEGSVIGPGSPSFRDYCIDAAVLSPAGSCKSERDHQYSKSDGNDNEINGSQERKEGNIEGSSVELVKSEHMKGRRFKIVLPKGGHVVVKSILNVTSSCYNPPCSTAPQKNQLMSQKVQPAPAISA